MIQGTKVRRIRVQYVSSHGSKGPPEQEIDMTKVKTQANDKWAQRTAHWTKGEGRWAHWEAGRPTRPADLPVGPTAFRFHVEVSYWLVMAV